jgi:HTH-type transcriptional regulator/antitoxin HigA
METMSVAAGIDAKVYGKLLTKALPRVLRSEQEYEQMLDEVEGLLEKSDGRSPEQDALLDLMALLVHDYEEKRYPLPQAEPRQMLAYLIEERGLRAGDVWAVVGSKSRVSEILSGKRAISREQAKRLASFFRVPVDLFL